MPFVQDVLDALEQVAPARYAFPWDKIGLQVGDRDQPVERAVVSLDRSIAAIHFAIESNAQLLLTHHPLIFDPIATVTGDTFEGRAIQKLIFFGVNHIAAHTNWDAALGGINDVLAAKLGLLDVQTFGSSNMAQSTKLVIFVPQDSVEAIVSAGSEAGAGVIGNYRRCAYIGKGTGTYEAGEDSQPIIGEPGKHSEVAESRIEMICPSHLMRQAVDAIRLAHPYEEPAIDVYPMSGQSGQRMGRIGRLAELLTLEAFSARVDASLDTKSLSWGNPGRIIERVAVVGGAADGEWRAARDAGAQVLVTGEVKQHVALEASESEFCMISAGHYATEHPGCEELAMRMSSELPSIEWEIFTPPKGMAGRPN